MALSGRGFLVLGRVQVSKGRLIHDGLFHSVGKSLFVDNTIGKVRAQLGGTLPLHKTIRLMESDIDFQFFVKELFSIQESSPEIQPTIFHIDVSPVVSAWTLKRTRRGGETQKTLHAGRERRRRKLQSSPIRAANMFWQTSASILIRFVVFFFLPARYRRGSTSY